MEFQKLAEERRSIRAYKENVTIPVSALEEIIRCAQEAPSWKNSQTARYYVVSTQEKLKSVKAECLPPYNQNSSANAPALIVTAFEKNCSGFDIDGNAVNEVGNEWGAYDLGLSNMLLCLKAKELGYDTLIMGIRDGKALRESLCIPESQEVVAVIAIGERASNPPHPPRKELSEVARFF